MKNSQLIPGFQQLSTANQSYFASSSSSLQHFKETEHKRCLPKIKISNQDQRTYLPEIKYTQQTRCMTPKNNRQQVSTIWKKSTFAKHNNNQSQIQDIYEEPSPIYSTLLRSGLSAALDNNLKNQQNSLEEGNTSFTDSYSDDDEERLDPYRNESFSSFVHKDSNSQISYHKLIHLNSGNKTSDSGKLSSISNLDQPQHSGSSLKKQETLAIQIEKLTKLKQQLERSKIAKELISQKSSNSSQRYSIQQCRESSPQRVSPLDIKIREAKKKKILQKLQASLAD